VVPQGATEAKPTLHAAWKSQYSDGDKFFVEGKTLTYHTVHKGEPMPGYFLSILNTCHVAAWSRYKHHLVLVPPEVLDRYVYSPIMDGIIYFFERLKSDPDRHKVITGETPEIRLRQLEETL